ncbi:Ger(x)C family spore germination protein [Cohnella panacarvi]|uniref:Ger(x)C family spore germination protein n=1 Tax=Cohnella panacarvi TaxID=400776 RepID=UPI00047A0108|nr:Ger(x)C family spore germination protein [Cohnella panacarvi]
MSAQTRHALAKLSLIVLAFLPLVATIGCWNSREIDKLAIVTALSIDRADSGGFELAFQVVMPGGQPHAGNSKSDTPFTIYGIRSRTLFEGIRKASKQVPRQLFFSHVQVVVLGEKLAKEGIQEVFDFFERSHEVRLTSLLLVARGEEPDKLISTLVPLERLQANAMLGEGILSSQLWSETAVVEIDDVIRKLINPGVEPTISGIKLIGNDKSAGDKKSLEQSRPPFHLEVSDIAMFKDGKLTGWFEGDAARGLLFVTDRIHSTIMNLPCGDLPEGVAMEIIKSKTKKEVSLKDGRLRVNVIVNAEGNIGEVKCGIPLNDLGVLHALEREWENAIRNNIGLAVRKAQQPPTDIFGFGMIIEQNHPKLWKSVESRWDSIFADAEVNVTFHGVIRRTGMRGKSLIKEQSDRQGKGGPL